MTSTHLELETPTQAVVAATTSEPQNTSVDSPRSDSNFSETFKDDGAEGNKAAELEVQVNDDYAINLNSDEENHSDSQDQSQAIEQTPTTVPVTMPSNGIASTDPPEQIISDVQDPPSIPTTRPTRPEPNEPSEVVAEETPITSTEPHPLKNGDITDGGIDIQQLLDNITANAEKTAATAAASSTSPVAALPPHASLPPRPQITQQPAQLQYPPQNDAKKYSTTTQSYAPTYGPPPGLTAPLIAAGAPGTHTEARNSLPPPPASFHASTQSPISQSPYAQIPSENQVNRPAEPSEEGESERPWGPAIQKVYDDFLADERMYVTEGAWDRFPTGSRLFIGNLPSEKVTKRDLFHIFHKYGRLAQVSIKQAYGFVQFHDSASCYMALDLEQGQEVRGRKMHLEISKAQRNTRNAQNSGGNASKRPHSPDRGRGGHSGRGDRNRGTGDRYNARQNQRENDHGRAQRVRDDYRPGRTPSPRGYRGRDNRGNNRGRYYYDGHDRRRSRSRSPYGYRDPGRFRERSPSPRSREAMEDADLPIPRRNPHDIPDVQVLLLDELDRNFVAWVESELRGRGIKSEILFVSPRLPLQAIIRRQILEGVHAVSLLDMKNQNTSKIPLQVFDRQGGAGNVRFDEYQDLEPKIAAELVLRARTAQLQVQPPAYAQPQFPHGQSCQPPQVAPAAISQIPNLANVIGQIDDATLQKVLGSLNTAVPQQHNTPAVAANSGIDLGAFLSGIGNQPQAAQQVYPPHNTGGYGNAGYGNVNAMQQTQQAPPQSAQQVQDIMAQLAKFRQ